MKKVFLLAATAAFMSISCTKDRTCTCTTTNPDGSVSDPQVITIVDAKKSSAKKACIDQTNTSNGDTYTTKCDLK